MKTKLFFVLLLAAVLLAACAPAAPEVGVLIQVPNEGISARQLKSDRSGFDYCTIPTGQTITVVRNTYWDVWEGAVEKWSRTFMSEVLVSSRGNCDAIRDILVLDKTLDSLIDR